jgi:hypothetical protein
VASVVPAGFPAYVRLGHPDAEGDLPAAARLLAPALRAVADDGRCYLAVWDGYGGLEVSGALFDIPHRRLSLYTGDVGDAVAGFQPGAARRTGRDDSVFRYLPRSSRHPHARPSPQRPPRRSPNLWWPFNQAWCVATDIDMTATYIGCHHDTADRLLSSTPAASAAPPDSELRDDDWPPAPQPTPKHPDLDTR